MTISQYPPTYILLPPAEDNPMFETLLKELVDVIEEKDGIVQQVEQDRIRYTAQGQCTNSWLIADTIISSTSYCSERCLLIL